MSWVGTAEPPNAFGRGLTSRSSGRVQLQRPASPVQHLWRAAQLQIRYTSGQRAMTIATRFAHPDDFSAWALSRLQAWKRPSCFQATNASCTLPPAAVVPAAQCGALLWSLTRPPAVGRFDGRGAFVAGRYNQSLERTRSAAASGFAGRQLCRAAQLQIR